MKVYWQMQPLIQGIYDLQAPFGGPALFRWTRLKKSSWLAKRLMRWARASELSSKPLYE